MLKHKGSWRREEMSEDKIRDTLKMAVLICSTDDCMQYQLLVRRGQCCNTGMLLSIEWGEENV